jgi:hypothetical protein
MDEHTHGTLRSMREATPTHDIKVAAGKLQTPGTVDRHFRKISAPKARSVRPVSSPRAVSPQRPLPLIGIVGRRPLILGSGLQET